MDPFGFVITRCVRSSETNRYWIECYRCIRKIYPDTPIVIIDDASIMEYVTDFPVVNCRIVTSRHPGRGELLPYVYLQEERWFELSVVLHDSVFINAPIPVDDVHTVSFLWDFTPCEHHMHAINKLITLIPDNAYLWDTYCSDDWFGCFGAMSVIRLEFLSKLPLSSLVDHILCREDRCGFERVFALLCIREDPTIRDRPRSVYGDVLKKRYWGYSYNDYLQDTYIPVKIWTGR